MQKADVGQLVGHRGVDLFEHAVDVFGVECQRRVVALDRLLDLDGRQVRQIAETLLTTAAEEIAVKVAAAPHGLGIDQAALAANSLAAAAEQHAFEVVRQQAIPLTAVATSLQHVLNAVEEGPVDQRFMTALDQLALVADKAKVVRVLQHDVQLAVRDRLGGPLRRGPRRQAQLAKCVGQSFQREVTAGVQLEGLANQWGALGVKLDAVDEPAFELDAGILVTDLCPTDGAAATGLVLQLAADVLAAHADLDLVHDVGNGLHGVAPDAVAEVLLGRDQLDAHGG